MNHSTQTKKMEGPILISYDHIRLTDHDAFLFKEGNHFQLYNKLGSHVVERDDTRGVLFAVWAPNALTVSVIGPFNRWNKEAHKLGSRSDSSGIWEGFIPALDKGTVYKYHITSKYNNYQIEKKDPYGIFAEAPQQTSSIVWDLDYKWQDEKWMQGRAQEQALDKPMSVYEVHLGSWRRVTEENNRRLTYTELANYLVDYVKQMGFTHVEFMPVMDHPFYGSWGYQTLGYFAPASCFGTPQEMMFLIDSFHQAGIGVFLDWVPSHFPSDGHGLVYFDGTHLFEHNDPQKGFHPDWKCNIFNNDRNEVKEFLISSALFWFDKYHVDGLRVDAVASMLYLDYSRKEGEWSPNIYGGRDNIESIAFIKQLNEVVFKNFPGVHMIAEESTAWAKVSRPTYCGGLGFDMKWNMGWMHDTLEYFRKDPVHRKHHQNELTFSMLYAFTENFVLSFSHDEVVHGKGSLINKMPGDEWQQFANLRLLYSYMYAHPGKKLLFMGQEFAQRAEWNHEQSLDWHLVGHPFHQGVQKLLKDLNSLYCAEDALYKHDFDSEGFECIDASDWRQSILCFLRKAPALSELILIINNFTPTPHTHYRVGVSQKGTWELIFNSDDPCYGGGGFELPATVCSESHPYHERENSISVNIPPLATTYWKFQKSPFNERPAK